MQAESLEVLEKASIAPAQARAIGELRGEMRRTISGSTRQMYIALLGPMAVQLGFIDFLFTELR